MFDEFGPRGAEDEREGFWTDLSEVPDEQHRDEQAQHLSADGRVHPAHARSVEVRRPFDVAHVLARVGLEAPKRRKAAVEHLHHRHAVHVLHRGALQRLAGRAHGRLARRPLRRRKSASHQDERRHDGDDERKREPPVHREQTRDGHKGKRGGRRGIGQMVRHEALDLLDVGAHHLLHLALAHVGEESGGHARELSHKLHAHLVQDVERRRVREHRGEVHRDAVHRRSGQGTGRKRGHEAPIDGGQVVEMHDHLVHHEVHEDEGREPRRRCRDGQRDRADEQPALAPRQLHEAREALLALGARGRGACGGGGISAGAARAGAGGTCAGDGRRIRSPFVERALRLREHRRKRGTHRRLRLHAPLPSLNDQFLSFSHLS